ncbi:hypothetical protein [Sphingomonas sp. SUN039]|uniref:hypothetical protein n=1 Tax=Sphingomonas sp. SUN039 TaxID=2937787 RepID=UPI00216422C6|nr:hypothetical protein [Sphingomonas sp. SUN039]UVO55441.1 hypothetical protein M0209_15410 [Sphingomonas sp. SUN039]
MPNDSPHSANSLTAAEAPPRNELDTLGDTTTYSPDDYRWVPVRRQARYDGWTEEKQRRFIEVLADTGLVGTAAKAVGLTRESAYRLRRAAGAEAFADAWDAARHHAGGLIEDIAFERAIEGVAVPVLNEHGEAIASRTRYDNRLLVFLLRRLRADRYGGDPRGGPPPGAADRAPPPLALSLRALEPALPAPPEELLGDELPHELEIADLAGGVLPQWLQEQRVEPEGRDHMAPRERRCFEERLDHLKRQPAPPPPDDGNAYDDMFQV